VFVSIAIDYFITIDAAVYLISQKNFLALVSF